MLVWTQVFRARLTGGRHARFAVTHETLLVRALVLYKPKNLMEVSKLCMQMEMEMGMRVR